MRSIQGVLGSNSPSYAWFLAQASPFPGTLFFWDFVSEKEVEALGYQPLVKEVLEEVTEAEQAFTVYLLYILTAFTDGVLSV